MNPSKAPRKVYGFTEKTGKELQELVAKNFNHYVLVESIEDNIATLKIHRFKEGKGKPAKDYKATITVTKMWRDLISGFENYKVIQ